jgi:hypothetical protein
VVGSLFKVCESYSESHLYVKEHFVKEHPSPLNVAAIDSPPSSPEGGSSSPRGEMKQSFQGHHVIPRRAQCDRRSVKVKRR